jgi:hypothetical protein
LKRAKSKKRPVSNPKRLITREKSQRTGGHSPFTSLWVREPKQGICFGLIGVNVSWIHNECITNTFIFREKEVFVILVMRMIKIKNESFWSSKEIGR